MHVLKLIKPIVSAQSQILCGHSIIPSGYYTLIAVWYPCVSQGQPAGLTRGDVMPRLTKLTTVTARKAADNSVGGGKPPASFSAEECVEVSLYIHAHGVHAPMRLFPHSVGCEGDPRQGI